MRGALGPHSWASTSSSTMGRLILGTLRRTYNTGRIADSSSMQERVSRSV
jgi:hypothetical protein